MVEFARFSLPVQYPAGIRAEHRAVREAAGLFDVSHMGEFQISGPDALECVQDLTVNDAAHLEVGQAQYSLICAENGGIIDDLVVYRMDESEYLLVVNAATRERDLRWIRSHQANFDVSVDDLSGYYALLALQGPEAVAILRRLVAVGLEGLKPFHFLRAQISGVDVIVSRTGYTGEDGFELYLEWGRARELWVDLLDAGSDRGLISAGLGARDILRLEMGYPLSGADLDEEHSALEAGLGWVVKLGKRRFLGRSALAKERKAGLSKKLVGIQMSERGFPRPGYRVISDDEVVGSLTSGTVSLSLDAGVALAYLPMHLVESGAQVGIRIRKKDLQGKVVQLPFYRDGSRKR